MKVALGIFLLSIWLLPINAFILGFLFLALLVTSPIWIGLGGLVALAKKLIEWGIRFWPVILEAVRRFRKPGSLHNSPLSIPDSGLSIFKEL